MVQRFLEFLMARISEFTLADIIGELPPVVLFDANSEHMNRATDEVFVCALGFEDRCLPISESLARSGYRSNNAVFLTYQTNRSDNERNKSDLRRALEKISSNVWSFDADQADFGQQLHGFLRRNAGTLTEPSITIDISVFSSKLLFQLISILLC